MSDGKTKKIIDAQSQIRKIRDDKAAKEKGADKAPKKVEKSSDKKPEKTKLKKVIVEKPKKVRRSAIELRDSWIKKRDNFQKKVDKYNARIEAFEEKNAKRIKLQELQNSMTPEEAATKAAALREEMRLLNKVAKGPKKQEASEEE